MASGLELYVNNVQTLSSQGNFSQLCDCISKSAEVLTKNASHLDNVLATLDVQQHSLGVLGILAVTAYAADLHVQKIRIGSCSQTWTVQGCVKYTIPIADFETLFVQTQEFILSCNGEHVRYATDSYADLCHKFTHNLVERKQANRGICILVTAINKIQLFPSQLTSIHADLCQLCLFSKNFKPALQFMDTDITDISKEGGHYETKDFLCYYYYGGMIYTALKKYNRALYFLEIVVTCPSMAVSHVMLEAYKKYILVALILHGKFSSLPKYTSQVVARYIKPLCQPYHDLVNAYGTNNSDELQKVIEKHQETYTRDNNMGLVKQCVTALYKKNIQRLTKTFLTLSLTDMANRVKLSGAKEAEKYVLHMIEDGEIYATINQKDGMVRFHDNPEKYNSSRMLLQLDQELQRCIQLDGKLKEMDNEIAVNPQYVQKSSGMHDEDIPGSSKMQQSY